MPEFAVDLHMHSCLSPCGDELMTPNNIVKMAALKGLDLIAVTDHNTARQLPSVARVCREIGVNLLPGLELTTREEVHLLAYFRSVDEAVRFSQEIYPHLPDIKNRPEFFGPQQLLDEDDEPLEEEPRLLLSALDLSLDRLTARIRELGGLPVPAHINRSGNGLLHVLGFVPPDAQYDALEIVPRFACPPVPGHHKVLHSSDAHCLEHMLEREAFLPLEAPTPDAFFAYVLGEGPGHA